MERPEKMGRRTINSLIRICKDIPERLYGALIQSRGKHQVMIRIESINQNLMINIPVIHLKKIKKGTGYRKPTPHTPHPTPTQTRNS